MFLDRLWKKISAGLAAILLSWFALVPIFAVDNNVTGVAPTQNTDGSTLTDLTSIKLYKVVLSGTNPNCQTATGYAVVATIPFTMTGGTFTYLDANVLQNGRHCYKASAVRATGAESMLSMSAFKDVDVRFPNVPTGLTVN